MQKEQLKVAVLLGGTSEERDVSIASGAQVTKALRHVGYDVIAVDVAAGILSGEDELRYFGAGVKEVPPAPELLAALRSNPMPLLLQIAAAEVDLCFLALHGGDGENGRLQAMLDVIGMPYTGSGALASGMAMDKAIAKQMFTMAGVRTPLWRLANSGADEATLLSIGRTLGFPLVVKPNSQGSTLGLSLVHKQEDLRRAITHAGAYQIDVLIEQFIAGRELTVGVLDGEPLAIGEIVIDRNGVFDYQTKYQGRVREIFPAEVEEEAAKRIREAACVAHRALRLNGYSRADFRLDDKGVAWCLEVNTLPGMTATSLLPQSAAAIGIDFNDLCYRICKLALAAKGAK
jgi:D-alanine-D-alanine ligase